MSEYPEDIMKAAQKHCDLAGVTPHSDMRVHCEHVAASAILAERKRCAKVAEDDAAMCDRDAEMWLTEKLPRTAALSSAQGNASRRLAEAIMGEEL